MTNYKAKKSNLNKLMQQNNSSLEALEEKTNIPMDQLDQYTNKKIMNLSNAMTISKELNCQIEDLYEWKTEE
ncbi:helix-turn-helix domain-containing protein [Bacillus seohaeanensis]|uniref:Helix-turn-helix domain-containing protein n=1 Tax=Bacillus seohaeanensis TaxID=284580 RepID=A0ABW5RPU9_9BACI